MFLAGLLHDPKRLAECSKLEPRYLTMPEVRAVFLCALRHNSASMAEGRVRYAGRKTLDRLLGEQYGSARPGETPARKKARVTVLSAARALIDSLSGWPRVDDVEFREALDDIRSSGLDEYARRGILDIVSRFESGGARGIHQELSGLLAGLAPSTGSSGSVLGSDASSVLVEYARAKADPSSAFIPVPFPRLAKVIKGGKRGRMSLVAAYAKDGKTALAKELIYCAACAGYRCAVVTSEQTEGDVRTMLVVRHSHKFYPGGLPYDGVSLGTLNPAQEEALRATVADIATIPGLRDVFYWQAQVGTTVPDIRALLEFRSRRAPLDVVMVDHTGLFSPSRRTGAVNSDAALVLRELKAVALGLNENRGVWLVACQQINRAGYEAALTRGYYLPYDMAETREAEQSCDHMIWGLQTPESRDLNEMIIGVGLNRWGQPEPKGWAVLQRFSSAAVLPLEESAGV